MRLELTGRHIRITAPLRRLVEDGIAKLDRLLHDSAVSLQAVLYQEKYRHRVEMTLHARGEHFFHGTGSGRDWEIAINQALEKINKQARKLKGKWTQGKRQRISPAKAASAAPRPERGGKGFGEGGPNRIRVEGLGGGANDDGVRGVRIIRARRTASKPMSVDEAALEVGDAPASYIVFRNATTDSVNVLFRRPDGNLGLIEPEA
jgi:putative sigma-54 modulation protein